MVLVSIKIERLIRRQPALTIPRQFWKPSVTSEYVGTKTIVLSTHILSDVEEVADYIILIKEGCLTKFEKIGGKDNE